MPKQIKLGFDRVPPARGTFNEPLYDIITGEILTSSALTPLLTRVERTIPVSLAARNSTPIVINNKTGVLDGGVLKVEEVFPEFSEVSTTLLGVTRAEEQLSLFSDVSTLGLDEETWVFSSFNSTNQAGLEEWYKRNHPLYGPRSDSQLIEYAGEQALAIRTFPVPYGFPFGPQFIPLGLYDEDLFPQYINFIAAGKILYNLYANNGFPEFAKANFVPDFIKLVDENNAELIAFNINLDGEFLGLGTANDVLYQGTNGETIQEIMDQIEIWTLNYQKLLNKELTFPDPVFQAEDRVKNTINGILNAQFTIRPGYADDDQTFGSLVSKRTYRYQPGRISGFTYGIRAKNDPGSSNIAVEWGITNRSDEYIFSLQGADFEIIRRSTVPLSDDLLIRQGLEPEDQTTRFGLPGQPDTTNTEYYETRISRDNFNYDALNGNGPSGYAVDFENVTMWKIEFGWYGAVGAKFYVYVPVGNDECRWILVHWLVIENGIDLPCLKDPNFRFKYLVNVESAARLAEPVFIYKYGASCFIDGGDEGTSKYFATRSGEKDFNFNSPVLSLFPKQYIINRDGIGILNEQKAYPVELSTRATQDAVVKLKKINGSPEGFHFHYSPGLQAGYSPKTESYQIQVSAERDKVVIIDQDKTFSGNFAKLIGPGIYNVYASNISTDGTQADVFRRRGYLYNKDDISDSVVNGYNADETPVLVDPRLGVFPVRDVGYNVVASSVIPITSSLFKIHFLNPQKFDVRNRSHAADFAICLGSEEPKLAPIADLTDPPELGVDVASDATEELRFGDSNAKFSLTNNSFLEWSCPNEFIDPIGGFESGEFYGGAGDAFDYDDDLPTIEDDTDSGGRIAGIVGEVKTEDFRTTGWEQPDANTLKVYFVNAETAVNISQQVADARSAEIGVDEKPSGIYIASPLIETTIQTTPILIKEYHVIFDISNADTTALATYKASNAFQTRSVVLKDNYDLFDRDAAGRIRQYTPPLSNTFFGAWNIQPLYLTIALRDFAKVNGIVVQEFTGDGYKTHTPKWITSSISNVPDRDGFPTNDLLPVITTPRGASIDLEPVSYQSISGQSCLTSDSQLTQPLRDGETIYTTYLGAGQSERINLEQIFNRDRNTIIPNKYNTQALYITAEVFKQKDENGDDVFSTPGTVEMGVTIREQA